MSRNTPEILAPAGDFASLTAAIQGGCNAVYFGLRQFNMRAAATNFELHDLPTIRSTCTAHNVRNYLTLNTIVFDHEIDELHRTIAEARHWVDAVICWDPAVIQACTIHTIPVHISTQASVSNTHAAQFYAGLGAQRIMAARECSLDAIRNMTESVLAEIEVFAHGAMCVGVSGRCFLSEFTFGKSANRGECLQNCRRRYVIRDDEEGVELELGNQYLLSAKDLCTIPFLEQLLDTGIHSLKIEGRGKGPHYVRTVTACYREAVEAYSKGQLDKTLKKELVRRLRTVYNRDFSSGFYLGQPMNEFTDTAGSKATLRKQFVGKVTNYYKKPRIAEVHVQDTTFAKGDTLLFEGPTTGAVEVAVASFRQNDTPATQAERGSVTLHVPETLRRNDKVYRLTVL
ncbi:MAG: U32 family peptidase [Candidatus Pacebacteria bacterium]|nr:U32 family peptidase [Candidatus Paceibacterota bacterium]